MRLVYLCRNCNLRGGQSRIAWELAQRAAQDGHEVHLVARRFPPDFDNKSIQGHKVFQLPSFVGEWWRFRSYARSAGSRAKALLTNGGVTHGFGDTYQQKILTLGNVDWNYAKLIPGRTPDRTAVFVKKRALSDPGLRYLILESRLMRQDLLDLIPDFDESKIKFIYPGIDVKRFAQHSRDSVRARISKEFGIPASDVWIAFAAGGDFEKRNVATLGQALLKLLHRPNWRVLFIGANKEAFAWPEELHNRSYFLGRLDDIGTVLPGCDLLAYPAWYDEFSLVCLEAMASGLPLVVSAKVGASEIISKTNQETGILKNPGDSTNLASLIDGMLTNESLRRRMADENRAEAAKYSWEAMFSKYKPLYEV